MTNKEWIKHYQDKQKQAVGELLDALGGYYGVARNYLESDDYFRYRICCYINERRLASERRINGVNEP
jgi:hypothetical protein